MNPNAVVRTPTNPNAVRHGLPQDCSRGCPRDRVVHGHPPRSARLVVAVQVVVGPIPPAPAPGYHRREPDLIDLSELEGSDVASPPDAVPDLKVVGAHDDAYEEHR